jgi:hypothetical protein
MTSVSDPEISAFLSGGTRTGMLGFASADGRPLVTPVPGELLRTAIAIAARYMGQDRAEEFGKRNAIPGELVVRLRPTKVIAALNVTA